MIPMETQKVQTTLLQATHRQAPRLAFAPSLALVVLLALGALPARAAGLLGEGTVVDSASGVVFVARPKGGIEAIDLTTGASLWTSADAAKPLSITGGVLLAQAEPGEKGDLVLATLNPRTGALVRRSALALPAGIRATVADGLQGSFRVRAMAANAVDPANPANTALFLAWTATRVPGPTRGRRVRPSLGVEGGAAPSGVLRGVARLDLGTGKIVAAVPGEAAGAAGEVDAGRFSLDGRYTLAAERIEGALNDFSWTLTERATGKVAGVLDVPASLAPITVAGSAVVYLARPSMRMEKGEARSEPLRLRALDLSTGAELWTREVRDLRFHGPFPP